MIKEYKTINGELSVGLEGNIMVAHYTGVLDTKLVAALKRAFVELTPSLNGRKWGYIGLSKHAQAATPEAEQHLMECMKFSWSIGCVAGAYILGSNLTINQLDRILKKAGLESGIEGKVFDTLEDAKEYVREVLSNF